MEIAGTARPIGKVGRSAARSMMAAIALTGGRIEGSGPGGTTFDDTGCGLAGMTIDGTAVEARRAAYGKVE